MQGQAEKLSKSRKKIIATTYQDFFSALEFVCVLYSPASQAIPGEIPGEILAWLAGE